MSTARFRRAVSTALVLTALLGASPSSLAQTEKVARIAFLSGSSSDREQRPLAEFRSALRTMGYQEGTTLLVERRGTPCSRIEATRGAGAESFFRVLPPVSGLDTLTIFAFIVQGLFFAASPTGGEGFTAQRFMAARNEFHAQVGQLFNALLTLIIRVVPFLFLGMIAAAIYAPGTVAEPGEIWARMVRTYAPAGLLGLLVAGVFAAYMSTISTLMNWGASYIVNDLYKPFIRQDESERHYVWVGRVGSVVIFALSLIVAYYFVEGLRAWFLFINSVVFAFILPLSWLRFFWWRLNIYGEAAALIIGLPLSYIVWFPLGFSNEQAHPFWQGFLLLFG